jgi:hypothetical protein
MSARERETGGGVIEGSPLPLHRGMAQRTVLAETGSHMIGSGCAIEIIRVT